MPMLGQMLAWKRRIFADIRNIRFFPTPPVLLTRTPLMPRQLIAPLQILRMRKVFQNERTRKRIAKETAKALVGKGATIGRLVANADEAGKSEINRLDDDGSGNAVYFDVSSMRKWVAANLDWIHLEIELHRVERLIKSGAVDPDHIREHTLKREPEPLILLRDAAGKGEDHLVDGSHRMVAFALISLRYTGEVPAMPAYIMLPHQWEQFVIPSDLVSEWGMQF